jgi:4-hydroxy-tetrahydrodipicolinate synthase
VPVIAGTGGNSTREAIGLSKEAKRLGADGMLQVTPYYNKPTQDGLYRHFKAIIEAAPLPTVVYNVPGRTGCDLLPETVARLCDIKEVVAVKEATGNLQRASQIIARVGDRLVVLSGDDATAFPLFAVGARGVISVVSNVAPADFAGMWDAFAAGDLGRARELHYRCFPLSEGLFIEANPIPVKSALAMMGKIADEIRAPLYPLSGANKEKVHKILLDLGLVR